MDGYRYVNYGGVVLSKITREDFKASFSVKEHTLLYVHSGIAEVVHDGEKERVSEGEGIFLMKDRHIIVNTSVDEQGRPFESIGLFFCRKFLLSYLRELPKRAQVSSASRTNAVYVKIPNGPALKSLFLSLIPYLESGAELSSEIAWTKRWEGLRCVLESAPQLFPSIFNFAQPWKVDLMEFMEDNWRNDLSLEEMAKHTGRSLSSFKRDFKKVCELTPERWVMKRRLEEAHALLSEDASRPVFEVMVDTGFKDMSTFSRAYKREYGYPPSKTPSLNEEPRPDTPDV